MLQIFLAAVLVIFSASINTQASDKVPDSLEQINADLLAKKAKADPFGGKSVKVDLESLGLDSVDSKEAEKEKVPAEETPKIPVQEIEKSKLLTTESKPKDAAQEGRTETSLSEKINSAIAAAAKKKSPQVGESKNADSKPDDGGAISKIQNFLRKTKSEESSDKKVVGVAAPAQDSSGATDVTAAEKDLKNSHINAEKKRNLKKQLAAKNAAKKKAAENEKKRLKKLAKLNELRAKYLIKINAGKSAETKNLDEDLSGDEGKIVPQKKEINKFVSYETAPPPILNRYRSHDNVGIPIVLSLREKIDNLFRSIGEEDISYFNSAYENLENPDVKNFSGDTILTYAILLQRYEVIASILGKGANPNLPNTLGYTPLQIATEILDFTSFNLLVNANADINYADGFGRTYLMHAARVGFLPGVQLLIEKGADLNVMDADGFTALAIAYQYKKDLIVALLLKHGAKTWIEKPYDPKTASMIQDLESRWKK